MEEVAGWDGVCCSESVPAEAWGVVLIFPAAGCSQHFVKDPGSRNQVERGGRRSVSGFGLSVPLGPSESGRARKHIFKVHEFAPITPLSPGDTHFLVSVPIPYLFISSSQ